MLKTILVLLVAATLYVNAQPSICDRYAPSFGNASVMVSAVVDQTVSAALDPKNMIDQFFNGKAGGTNFTSPANNASFAALRNGLITFFGSALGCTDKSIGPYVDGDFTAVHKALNIPFISYFTFNNALLGVLLKNGVNASDVATVAGVLDTLRTNTCTNATDCFSICNKLVVPGLANSSLAIGGVVAATVGLATKSDVLLQYFNGSKGNHGSFLPPANQARFDGLFDHLVKFFGGKLGCSDGTIGAYDGMDLVTAHAGMQIDTLAFDTFNAALMSVIAGANVTGKDYTDIYTLLNSTKPAICTAADCGTAPGSTTGGATGTTSGGTTGGTTGGSTGGTVKTTGGTTGGSTGGTTAGTTGGTTAGTTGKTTAATTTPAPTPTPSSTGFGLVLVAPIFTLLSVFLF